MSIMQDFAKQVISRVHSTQITPKGKRAADAALEMYIGAAMAFRAVGDNERMDHFLRVAAMIVSPRGMKGVHELAVGE